MTLTSGHQTCGFKRNTNDEICQRASPCRLYDATRIHATAELGEADHKEVLSQPTLMVIGCLLDSLLAGFRLRHELPRRAGPDPTFDCLTIPLTSYWGWQGDRVPFFGIILVICRLERRALAPGSRGVTIRTIQFAAPATHARYAGLSKWRFAAFQMPILLSLHGAVAGEIDLPGSRQVGQSWSRALEAQQARMLKRPLQRSRGSLMKRVSSRLPAQTCSK